MYTLITSCIAAITVKYMCNNRITLVNKCMRPNNKYTLAHTSNGGNFVMLSASMHLAHGTNGKNCFAGHRAVQDSPVTAIPHK